MIEKEEGRREMEVGGEEVRRREGQSKKIVLEKKGGREGEKGKEDE